MFNNEQWKKVMSSCESDYHFSKLTNSLTWTLHFCSILTIEQSPNCNKSYAKRNDQKNRDIIYSHHSFDGKEKRTRDIKTDKNSMEMLSA